MRKARLFGTASAAAALGLCAGVTTTALLVDGDDQENNQLSSGSIELFASTDLVAPVTTCPVADLAADDWSPTFLLPAFADLVPGDSRSVTVCIRNGGSVDGAVTLQATDVEDLENTCIDPEGEVGDVSCGPLQGELSHQLSIGVSSQQASGADCALPGASERWFSFADLQQGIDLVSLSAMSNSCITFVVDWSQAPDASGSLDRDRANGDAVKFDLVWTLTQVV
jgi:hypothetical protein